MRLALSCLLGLLSVSELQAEGEPARAKLDVGQLVITGFLGTSVTSPGFQAVLQNLEDGLIGGVLFLPRNMTDAPSVKNMTAALKSCACRSPPFIALDEEGGRIQRLGPKIKGRYIPGASEVAGMPQEEAMATFEAIAMRVKMSGFNLNFAPVVDLRLNKDSSVIAHLGRSYSDSPAKVTQLAEAFLRAHRSQGVLTSIKHFPGHGSASGDTHRGGVDVSTTWKKTELTPYRVLMAARIVDTVMVGHITSKLWHGTASQSGATAISELLRKQLGYDGVVISDDLYMGAVRTAKQTVSMAAVSSLDAGADVIIVSRLEDDEADVGPVINDAISDAIEHNKLNKAKITAALKRVAKLKERLPVEPDRPDLIKRLLEAFSPD